MVEVETVVEAEKEAQAESDTEAEVEIETEAEGDWVGAYDGQGVTQKNPYCFPSPGRRKILYATAISCLILQQGCKTQAQGPRLQLSLIQRHQRSSRRHHSVFFESPRAL